MPLDHLGRGPKNKLAEAIEASKVLPGDLVVTTGENGNELVLVERDKSQVVITSRTQDDIQVMGVNFSTEIADGKVIPAGTNLDQFVKKLVQKRIPATYTQPSVTLANNAGQGAGVVEAGTTVSVKVRSTFNKADAGAVTSHKINKNGAQAADGVESTLEHTEELIVPDGATTFASTVAYAEGPIKEDNFGDESPTGHIMAGSKNSSNYVITGARKVFYGTGAGAAPELNSEKIRALANSKLDPKAGEKINIQIKEGEQHLIVSLPSNRTLKQVTYVDLGDKGMLEKFSKSTVNVAGAGGAGVAEDPSNTYVYSMAAPAAAAMNFELLLA